MIWTQIATLIVSIAATAAAGTGVIVLSVNGIHPQVAALRTQAAADRRAWQASMSVRHRAPQPPQLLAPNARQTVLAATLIAVGLTHPVADRLR